jgi:hypothetical protein
MNHMRILKCALVIVHFSVIVEILSEKHEQSDFFKFI